MSAVSKVTNILVYGVRLEDGRPVEDGNKYKKAKEIIASSTSKKCLKIMSEDDFIMEYLSKGRIIGGW